MMAPRATRPPGTEPPTMPTSSAWETQVEDLVPADVLAELKAQVAARAQVRAQTGSWPAAPARVRVHRPDPAAPVLVELGDAHTEAIEALRAAMKALGVTGELSGVLTTLTLACGTLTTPPTTTEASAAGTSTAGTSTVGDRDAEEALRHAGAPVALARARDLLSVIETVDKVSNQLDGVLVSAVRDLTAVRGRLLMADKGVADPDELSASQREKWTKAAKSATRHELEAALGWYASEIKDLVALATSPATTLAPVLHSLATGESSWATVRRFYRAAGPLPHEDTAAIANGLFGDDPDASVTDRLDSEGGFTGAAIGMARPLRLSD